MSFIYIILLGIAMPFLLILLNYSRRQVDIRIHKRKEGKDLPTILYLRSFDTDGKNNLEAEPSPMTPLAGFIDYKVGISHESGLARRLTHFAHLIAVGRPGEDSSEMGFKRVYFPDETWKEEVAKLIIKSDVIIYRPNLTAPLFWELEQVIEQKALPKLVIWNLAGDEHKEFLRKAIYKAFRKKIDSLYKITLPEYSKTNRFIFFNESGKIDSTHFIKFERREDKTVRIFKDS